MAFVFSTSLGLAQRGYSVFSFFEADRARGGVYEICRGTTSVHSPSHFLTYDFQKTDSL
jgi:hypothetical protein